MLVTYHKRHPKLKAIVELKAGCRVGIAIGYGVDEIICTVRNSNADPVTLIFCSRSFKSNYDCMTVRQRNIACGETHLAKCSFDSQALCRSHCCDKLRDAAYGLFEHGTHFVYCY